MLVGGTAVAFYGYVRPTTSRDGTTIEEDDFDFWYNPRFSNYNRLLFALEDLGLDLTDVREEQLVNLKRSFFRHHFADYTLDFIPTVAGDSSFGDCYKRSYVVQIEQTEIPLLSLNDLIVIKTATGRKKI
jgi:hypothetical protein